MPDQIALELEPRNILGKKVKSLRRAGTIPVHLYGPGVDSRSLQGASISLLKVIAQAGRNTPVSLTVRGESPIHVALIRDVSVDPMKRDLLHVDFLAVDVTHLISAEVPIVLHGEAPGALKVRGTVVQSLHSVEIEALPMEIPHELGVDLALLTEPDSVVRADDIPLPSGVTLLTDPETMVARIEVARAEVEEEVKEAPQEAPPPAAEEHPRGAQRE